MDELESRVRFRTVPSWLIDPGGCTDACCFVSSLYIFSPQLVPSDAPCRQTFQIFLFPACSTSPWVVDSRRRHRINNSDNGCRHNCASTRHICAVISQCQSSGKYEGDRVSFPQDLRRQPFTFQSALTRLPLVWFANMLNSPGSWVRKKPRP